MIDIVLGRATDFLYLPDGNVKHALSIIYPLREMKGVRRFRVTQHRNYAVTVEVVCDDRAARVTREAVARRVQPVVGDQVPIRVKLVADIPASPSGKYRYVQSHVQPTSQRLKEESTAGVQDYVSR